MGLPGCDADRKGRGRPHARRRSNIHLYPDDWKQLPIPDATPEAQAPIVALVEQALAALKADPGADVSALEREIDKLVSRLYGVGDDEGEA